MYALFCAENGIFKERYDLSLLWVYFIAPVYFFQISADVDEEAVRIFLRANPVFLEDYVMKHVDQDRLERWLIRKTRKLKIKAGKKPSSSLDHENNKQSGKRPVLIWDNVNSTVI